MNKSKRYFWLDAALFVVFVIITISSLSLDNHGPHPVMGGPARPTRVLIHTVAGLTLLAGSGLHLAWHRAWVKAAFKRTDRPRPRTLRRHRTVDMWLFALLAQISLSGLLLWPMAGNLDHGHPPGAAAVLGLTYHAWKHVHALSAIFMFLLLIVHLIQHRSWLVSMVRRFLLFGGGSLTGSGRGRISTGQ